uniref:Bm3343 n=1 Tax=Wuchereria bancrofti TaxID=6293 RepID=A0AAF5PKA1_WUCBA
MGAEAKRYLQEHAIPQLFESLITGLICNKPEDPIEFLESSLGKVRQNPSFEYKWDSFVDKKVLQEYDQPSVTSGLTVSPPEKPKKKAKSRTSGTKKQATRVSPNRSVVPSTTTTNNKSSLRPSSVMQTAEAASIPDVPIVLFMGGPGGGKTRHAARVQEALSKFGLVHICMPDMIRAAIAKYQNINLEWKEAAQRYQRGELIPNNLALGLVKAEMSEHQGAKAFFLEGFPREARQVESFEREVKPVNMAMILDYDEITLRHHMESRGLDTEIIDAKIREFKLKTLPSAKYFDDQRLLHLIPGEQSDQWIFERMKLLIQRAMELGVPVTTSKVASRAESPLQRPDAVATVAEAVAIVEAAVATAQTSENQSCPATKAEVEKNETKADLRLSSATGAEGEPATLALNSPVTARDITNTRTSASEKPTSETTSEKDKPLTASKRQPSRKGNAASESKLREVRVDSAITNTEVREKSQISGTTSESITQPAPVTPVSTNDAPNLEGSSQSSRQSTKSFTKKTLSKISRTVSQTSKSSETSRRSPHSAKSGSQSAQTIKSETQLIGGPSPDSKSNASAVDNRFPPGLPNNASAIVIVGPPGSNKAEISKRIAVRYDGFMYLSMGDLLRKEVQVNADDQLWRRIGKKMDGGEAVPTKICRELLYSKIYDEDNISSGYIIEGYPRAKNQAIDFENQIDRLVSVILIDCTEDFCIETIKKRKKEGIVVRTDDNPEVINARLQMFKQNTLPMLKYFDDKGKLKVVDGDNNLEKIFEEIVEELDSTILAKDRECERSQSLSEESQKKIAGQ